MKQLKRLPAVLATVLGGGEGRGAAFVADVSALIVGVRGLYRIYNGAPCACLANIMVASHSKNT